MKASLQGIDGGSVAQYHLQGLKGQQDVTARRVSGSDIILYALSSYEANRRTMLIVMFTVVILALSITMGLAAIQIFSIKTILAPLRKMLLATRRMAAGDYHARSEYRSMDEAGELSDSFNGMAETIEARNKKLKDLLQQQKDFMFHTVHEMSTPINHFRWTLELMRFGEVGALTPEQMELVEQLHATNRRLERMVQNIIDTEKLSENRLIMAMEAVDPTTIIDDVAGELSVQARAKRIELRWIHPKGGLPKIRADKEQLRRIISNLLGNAVKYTDVGGHVEVTAESCKAASGKASVIVTVADNGRGIPKKDQEHLFSRFYRASNVVKKDIEGTGLGLYIVHKLVELHGGTVTFTSEEGHGSTFAVTLPAIDPSAS
jgi:two-component system sensor histidine kinase MtrB